MISLRAKKLKSGKFSLFLDYNRKRLIVDKQGQVKYVRDLEYLQLYVSKDYTALDKKTGRPKIKKIAELDKETWHLAQAIRVKRELAQRTSDRELIRDHRDEANFVEFCQQEVQDRSNRIYEAAYRHLQQFTGGQLQFRAINVTWIENFKTYLLCKVSRSSAQQYLSILGSIYRIALRQQIVQDNPFERYERITVPSKEPIYLELAELEKMRVQSQNIPKEIVNAFFFACYTGLRYSDVKKLTWQEIKAQKFLSQKTQKIEKLSLPEGAQKILSEQDSERALVFALMSQSRVNTWLKKWAKQAGIDKKVTFHVARHTCATLLITQGVDLYVVSKYLGHQNISTTQIYAQVIEDKKKEAADKLPLF